MRRPGQIAARRLFVWATLAASACGLVACGTPKLDVPALDSRPAAAFLDSVGVNVHTTYYDTAYGRFDEWSQRLRTLGIRHVRDGFAPGQDEQLARLRRLGQDGVRVTLGFPTDQPPARTVAAALGPLWGTVEALEGPNEPDARGPDWEPGARAAVQEIAAANDKRLPLIGPSPVSADARHRLADLGSAWQTANIHPYAGGLEPSANLPAALGLVGATEPGKPVVATEVGYHNAVEHRVPGQQAGVPERVAAAYVPRTFAEFFAAGVKRTFLYELLDEKPDPAGTNPEQHFGLLRRDLTPKPAFEALRAMMSAIRTSPGSGDRRAVGLADAAGAAKAGIHTLLLDRDDGSRVLLLWRAVPLWDPERRTLLQAGDVGVTLRFAGAPEGLVVTPRPSGDMAPSGTSIRVVVGPAVRAVSFR